MTTQNQQTPQTPQTQPSAPQPHEPGYAAYMASLYEKQEGAGPEVLDVPVVPPNDNTAVDTKNEQVDPDAKKEEPKPDETKQPTGEQETPKEDGADTKTPFQAVFSEANAVEAIGNEISTTGKFSDKTREGLVKGLGLDPDLVAEVEAGLALLQKTRTEALHTAAGGKEQFDAALDWAKKNLKPTELAFYQDALNSEAGTAALQVLVQRAGIANTQDPTVFKGSGGAVPGITGYESQAEMVKDMSDPRYQADPAFRNRVARRLALSRPFF